MKCPNCNKRESEGFLPLLQKDGSIFWEVDLCEECNKELMEEWVK